MKPTKTSKPNRRDFIKHTAVAGAGLALSRGFPAIQALGINDLVRVGVIGLGRGMAHVRGALSNSNVEVAYLCDVDEGRLGVGLKEVEKRQERAVQGVLDFRRVLEDDSVDAVMIATPNHWHAPATILACSAGKHVYVEKPGSHNPWEGRLMVAAARHHARKVQMGNQRRTWPAIQEGMAKLKAGVIGKVLYSRCWYNNARGSIGKGKPAPVPANLDYDIWQGPAPRRPYKDNLVHYNWHWHWHWGNGELGNNGIHALDLSRWGLGVDYPIRVSYTGGRYHYSDDQETPDTAMAVYDFGASGACWDGSSCLPRKDENIDFVRFYGEGGSLAIRGNGYVIFDIDGKEVARGNGPGGDQSHMDNFFDSIRLGACLNSEIEEGQKSTLLCHLGNIAYRTGSSLEFDGATQTIRNHPAAQALWKREYEPGWEPKIG